MQFEALRAVEFLLYCLSFLSAIVSLMLYKAHKYKMCLATIFLTAVFAFAVNIFTHFVTLTEKEDVKSMSNKMLRQQSVIHSTDLSGIKPEPKPEINLEEELAKEKAKSQKVVGDL